MKLMNNWRIALIVLVMAFAMLISYQLGQSKPPHIIDYLDVLGEGSTLVLTILAVVLVVVTRPQGRVTNHFYSGGLILIFSLSLDLLDEFVRYPDDMRLLSWLESLPQPLGLALLALGAFEWRKEHLSVTRQLATREKYLREHQWLDPLTTLYTARYFGYLLQREISLATESKQPLCIAYLNLTQFAKFNQLRGSAAGDELLHKVGELITLLLRPTDCVCRDHSDRFLMLLPETSAKQAQQLMDNLRDAITRELKAPKYLECTISVHPVRESSAEQALQNLGESLDFGGHYEAQPSAK
ncbi:GGDEF domain-containing protein [Pseudidiomarina planktonica]|nr:GGDEF domain-containing protein [Pseudidiomarina planktonica]RUO65419.1 GGDEF domain-containing protein [Pseudidiomarina planktonica]